MALVFDFVNTSHQVWGKCLVSQRMAHQDLTEALVAG